MTRPDPKKALSLLLIPAYIVIIVVLYYLGGTAAFPAPLLLLVANTVFLGLIPLYVAYIGVVSFRRSGLAGVLMMGVGMVAFGVGGIAAGMVGLLPDSANLVVTTHNTSACIGAALQFGGALAALLGWTIPPARRTALAASVYAAAVVAAAALVLGAVLGLTPVFFSPVTGSTAIRSVVLACAVEFFLVASGLFFVLYRKQREDFFFWYAVGLALIGLGLLSLPFYLVFDGLYNWAARLVQYAGACYILAAFLVLQRRASGGNVPVQEMLASFFAEAEAGYRELVETAADAIVVLDPSCRVLLWNTAAATLFGYARDEAVGASFPAIVGIGGDACRGELGVKELEAGRRDGSRVMVEMTVSRRDVAGQAITTCIVRDLTERQRAGEELRRYADDLRRSNEELQRFAYVASHDLQEPLRSVVSFSQLLERRYKGKLDADADDYIAFIVEGGTRMQTLIRDLLQLSRVETGAKPLEPTDVAVVVADVVRSMETPLREAGATVEVGEMPVVMADAAQLEQVFMNLIGNALKYRREGVPPAIAIAARHGNPMVELSVADNGIGIEPEYFDRIFEMFRRLHTHDQYEGTGIGLAVVKKIVERHGGKVRVESTPGEGSTFFFTLPAA